MTPVARVWGTYHLERALDSFMEHEEEAMHSGNSSEEEGVRSSCCRKSHSAARYLDLSRSAARVVFVMYLAQAC